MKKVLVILSACSLFTNFVVGQNTKSDTNYKQDSVMVLEYPGGFKNDTIKFTYGPEKYKNEVIGICKSYSKIIDSLDKDWFAKMSKNSLYSEKERKNRPKKYWGYDGGYSGYLRNEEDQKIKSIINRFLKIDRITSSSKWSSGNGPVHYDFNYSRTIKRPDGKVQTILGVVSWLED